MSKRWIRRIVVVAIIALAVAALRLTVLRPRAVPVTVFRAARGRVEDTVTNSRAGTVKSRRRATLSPELGGRVVELPARRGMRVRAGDVLLRIESADLEARLALERRSGEAARASAREACLSAEQAGRDLARYEKLAATDIVSAELLDQTRSRRDAGAARCAAARAQAAQAEAAVELARVNRDKAVLTAPFDGIVAEVSTQLGEWITPSPPGIPIPAVVVLLDPDSTYIVAPLDEVDVERIRVGLAVRVTLDAYRDRKLAGSITEVAPYVLDVAEQSRTLEVEVELADRDLTSRLLPGVSADVEVILDSRDDVLRVPSYALVEGGRVLVVRQDRLEAVPVQTGLRNWEFVEIERGLQPGDPVVVSLDREEVKPGARVRIEAETDR